MQLSLDHADRRQQHYADAFKFQSLIGAWKKERLQRPQESSQRQRELSRAA